MPDETHKTVFLNSLIMAPCPDQECSFLHINKISKNNILKNIDVLGIKFALGLIKFTIIAFFNTKLWSSFVYEKIKAGEIIT